MRIDMTTPAGALGFEGDRALPATTRAEFERTAALSRRPESLLRVEEGERDVDIIVGTTARSLRERVEAAVPDAEVFVSGLEWLTESSVPGDTTKISRLLLVDRNTILVSAFSTADGARGDEKAVFGRGFDNGIVAIARRLMATGLQSESDPGHADVDAAE